MRFKFLPLLGSVFFLIALSCLNFDALAEVPRETIERLAEINVEKGEIRHLNLVGKLTDQEYYARQKPLDTEASTLWKLIPGAEHNAAQSAITGLTRAKLSLLEPRWEKEQTEFQEARRRQKEQIGIELEKDARTAADFQRQRLLLQRQLDKGAIDRDSFTVKDKEAQAGISTLRKKFEAAGGSYPRRFDERLTLLTKALADNPDTVLPRSQVPATVEGKGTGRGGEPDFNSDVKLAAELLVNSEEISWKFEKKQVSSDTFRETAKVYSHDLSRLRARYDAIKRGDQFEAAYTRLAAPAIQAIRVKYQPEKYRQTAPTTTTQRPPPPPDYTLYYWLGGGGLLLVIFWLASLGKKEEAPAGPTVTDIHGTAHWTPHHYQPAGHGSVARGVTFGKSAAPNYHRNAPGAPVTSLPENHVLVIAKAGAGKGARVIMPTLGTYASGMCVVDPKGENAAVTARTRRDRLGQDIQILNPWGVLKDHYAKMGFQTATYNPLDMLDRNDPNITSLAKTLAATISPVTDPKAEFWQGMAARVLTGTFLWLTDQEGLPRYDDPSQPETKTLARVAELVNLPKTDFQKFLARLMASKAFHGDIRQQVGQMADSSAADTYGGIMLHLQGRTDFIDTPLKISTASSSISFAKLAEGTLTVYLVIPFDYIKTHGTWLRLIISAATKAITTARQKHPEKPLHRCMFLIDEFGSIGYIPAIAADLAQLRGYGIDFTLILQNLGQLKDHYKDAKDNILGSCGYKYFCWIKDLDTQKYLSESLGKKTVQTVGKSQSTGATQAGQTEGTSTTYGETGRNLLNPDEIDRLDRDTAILLQPYGAPHYLHTIDYFELTTAYAPLKDSHPELYWNPPLSYDDNPYIKKTTPQTLFPNLKNLPPIVPPPPEFFTPPPPKAPPKTFEDFVSKESLEDFYRTIRDRGGVFPPTPPRTSAKDSGYTPEQIAAVKKAMKEEKKWKPEPGSFDLNEPDDPPPDSKKKKPK